jgi:Protein of unknown function (DUF2637)
MKGERDTRRRRGGRGWAYFVLLLGGTASVVGNIAHTVMAESDTSLWLRVPLAAFWPVLLLGCIELLARAPWDNVPWHWLARLFGIPAVAGVAAVVSFIHLSKLMRIAGEVHAVSIAGPLAIDGAMVMATVALLATRPGGPEAVRTTLAQRVAAVRANAVAVRSAASGGPAHVDLPPDHPDHPDHVARTTGPDRRTRGPARTTLADLPADLPPDLIPYREGTREDRVWRAVADYPHMSRREISELTEIPLTTVKRHWPKDSPNGATPEQETAGV